VDVKLGEEGTKEMQGSLLAASLGLLDPLGTPWEGREVLSSLLPAVQRQYDKEGRTLKIESRSSVCVFLSCAN